MPTLLLIRHGENEYTRTGKLAGRLPGVHLNDHGRQQAETLAAALKDAPIKAIYSSPLERAMETAQPLANALNLTVQERPDLQETNVGDWQDQSMKRLSRTKEWKFLHKFGSRFTFPNGESIVAQQARLVAEVENILAGYKNKDVVACFSHADPIKLVLAFYTGMALDHFQRIVVETASISALGIGEGHAYLLKVNCQAKELGKLPV